MSLRAELLRLGLRGFLKLRDDQLLDIATLRAQMRGMERLVPKPPRRSASVVVEAAGLRFCRITTPATQPSRHVLYLHGGAYVAGGPAHYRHFTWRLADLLGATIWVLDYRLAPEHPFPAAIDDAAAAWRWLSAEISDPERMLVMGDSAGGGLTLALLMKLRDEGARLPIAAVAVSPWTDLALTGASLAGNAARDPMLNASHLPAFVAHYLAGQDPRHPYASPLYGDTAGLPPVLIQVGGDEILRDDAVRMADRLRQHNPASRLAIWPRMPHVWPLFVPALPEAHRAIRQIGAFVAATA